MATITAPGLHWLDEHAGTYAALMREQVGAVCRAVAESLPPRPAEHDAGLVYGQWQTAVEDVMLPALRAIWDDAAGHVRDQVAAAARRAAGALTAAAAPVPIEIGPVTDEVTAAYLAAAGNRMVATADVVWEAIRAALLAGLEAGEGITDIAARVIAAADIATPRAEVVARTEVVGASNAGALTQIQAIGLPGTKEWIATDDDRTRPDHHDADGQTADIRGAFTVGGIPMQRPHDEGAPAGEVVNCRCTLSFEISDGDLVTGTGQGPSLAAAANAGHTGAMIALVPSADDVKRLAVDGGEDPGELHCTLAFLGEAGDWTPDQRTALAGAVEAVAQMADGPFDARGFHVAHFNPGGEEPCWVLGVGGEDLATVHGLVWDAIGELGHELPELPEQHTPWCAHVTLVYTGDPGAGTDLMDRAGPVRFDAVRVAFGGEVTDMPLGGATLAAAGPGEEGTHMTDTATEHPATTTAADQPPPYMPGQDDESPAEQEATGAWTGPLVVEGKVTGDGREFAPGGLTWPDPGETVIPLRWNIEDSHGGEARTKAVLVGRIDRIWRDGNLLMGEGRLDLGGENGQEAYRLVDEGFLAGVSIDADDISDADVEFIWPDDAGSGGEDEMPVGPEKILFKSGRIRGATLCDIPAFVEAWIRLDDRAAVTAGAVGSHESGTSDGEWDGPANEGNLPSPVPEGTARKVYAWIDDGAVDGGELPKSGGKFPHHEVSADGTPGAANLAACSSGIGVLNGGRGGSAIPPGDRQGVYAHLAAHLRDGGQEPPEAGFTTGELLLTASGVTVLDEHRPPAAWFTDPRLTVPIPITVTDEGRVFGHAALWGQCHVGFEEQCVTAPQEPSHDYFLTGEVVLADGSRAPVGQITLGTGHAPLYMGARAATEHYDNTGTAVADVTVGNDEHGIWVAGQVRPGTEPARVRALQASGQLSGDWRRIGGQLRLVGLLAVNVPGFGVPRLATRVASGVQTALVAAGIPATGRTAPALSPEELEQLKLRAVADHLAARVHPPAAQPDQPALAGRRAELIGRVHNGTRD